MSLDVSHRYINQYTNCVLRMYVIICIMLLVRNNKLRELLLWCHDTVVLKFRQTSF